MPDPLHVAMASQVISVCCVRCSWIAEGEWDGESTPCCPHCGKPLLIASPLPPMTEGEKPDA